VNGVNNPKTNYMNYENGLFVGIVIGKILIGIKLKDDS